MRITKEQADDLAIFFSGLAHPTRVQLVGLLLDEERNVSELTRALSLTQARVSRHLQTLRHCGCCASRQEGSWVYYRARDPQLIRALLEMVMNISRAPGD